MSKSIRAEFVGNPEITELLDGLVGKDVTVTWTSVPLTARGFHPAVSVQGELQRHPKKAEYRVLVNEHTYAYLVPDAVMGVNEFSGGTRIFVY